MFGGLLHLAIPTEKIILEFYDYSIKHGLVSNKAFEYYRNHILLINLSYLRVVASVMLLVASIGIFLRKQIAYWLMIVSWVVIMISGLYSHYILDIKYKGMYNPSLFCQALCLYGMIPIAAIIYLVVKRDEIKEFILFKEIHFIEIITILITLSLLLLAIINTTQYYILIVLIVSIILSFLLIKVHLQD